MKVNYTKDRISVDEAAEMLQMDKQALRRQMISGKLPIGTVDKSANATNNHYYIYKSKVIAYLKSEELINDKLDLIADRLSSAVIDKIKEKLNIILTEIAKK